MPPLTAAARVIKKGEEMKKAYDAHSEKREHAELRRKRTFAANDPRNPDSDNPRGIQNVGVVRRSEENAERRLLQTKLREKSELGTKDSRRGSANKQSNNTSSHSRGGNPNLFNSQEGHQTLEQIQTMFKAEGENFDAGDMDLLVKDPPQKPGFPVLMLPIAIFKDIVDFADLTGVGTLFTMVTSFVLAIILFIWFLGKMQGAWWKKKVLQKLLKRCVISIVIESVPLGKMIPATTILILMTHFHETKIVQLMNSALERLRHGGIK